MPKLCIFAGTTEGRRLIEFLSHKEVSLHACVATDYGEALLEPSQNLTISAKRMDSAGMSALFAQEHFDLVIDATHPYASIVTENIICACSETGTEYLRLERDAGESGGNELIFDDIGEAVAYLNKTDGSILLTTGSKELAAFSALENFSERVYARVLPMEDSLSLCKAAGLAPSHIIAMQGPFSEELNIAMMKSINAAYIVTKQSGKAGGFDAKAVSAEKVGAKLIVIGRPPAASSISGLSYSKTLLLLEKRFGFSIVPRVSIAGIGMGGKMGLTLGADSAIKGVQCIIGAKRMLELARADQKTFEAVSPNAIADFIHEHNEFSRFAVLMSGDTGFFSGTRKLLPLLDFCDVEVVPGISSLSYLCSKTGLSYEDVKTVSIHGREANIAPIVSSNRRVFVLVGGENGAGRLIDFLACDAGLEDIRITVGEKLGYPDERITSGTAAELMHSVFDSLSAVYIENSNPRSTANGLLDEAFIRIADEKPIVPMTKSEVRAIALSKLRLLPDSICWDIGSGTGSVSIEAALNAYDGMVYAIEKKHDAIELTKRNARAFAVSNIQTIEGAAPEACIELPRPTHAFIGGSSGNMKRIIELLLAKSPDVRIVAAAISLETVAELNECMNEFGFEHTEVVCVNISKGRQVGSYNLMSAQNPVYIFTMQGIGQK